MKRLKRLIAVLTVCALVAGMTGCGSRFDASGYTEAILNLQFQGDTTNARTFLDGTTQTSLSQMYKEFVENFVAAYITSGMTVGETRSEEFADLASSVLTSMRYEVGKAKKAGKKEYEVPVVIEPADTFIRYQDLLTEDSIKISNKIKKGGYKGSEEEIESQVLTDIADHAYDLLAKAHEDTQYGEKETVILKVKADSDDIYSIDEDDMDNLIKKILRLDEIGG